MTQTLTWVSSAVLGWIGGCCSVEMNMFRYVNFTCLVRPSDRYITDTVTCCSRTFTGGLIMAALHLEEVVLSCMLVHVMQWLFKYPPPQPPPPPQSPPPSPPWTDFFHPPVRATKQKNKLISCHRSSLTQWSRSTVSSFRRPVDQIGPQIGYANMLIFMLVLALH